MDAPRGAPSPSTLQRGTRSDRRKPGEVTIFIADVVAIALMHRRRYRRRFLRLLQGGDTILHRLLHLLEGAHLDLAHALARDAEFGCQILERDRIVRQAARLEDAPLALVEHVERADQ